MDKYGFIMAQDYFEESIMVLTEDIPKNYQGTLLYKCDEADAKIAELEADNRECRRLLQLFLNNQGHPNLMLRSQTEEFLTKKDIT